MNFMNTKIPTHPFERAQWILLQLRLKGTNLSRLARSNDLTPSALSNCLRSPHQAAEKIIASALGVEAFELFPERFLEDGTRLHRERNPAKNNSRSVGRNGKASRAA